MSTPNTPSGGPPLRALAMVLIALAIVFAGLGAMSLSSSDSSDAGAASSASTTTAAQPAAATTTVAQQVSAPPATTAPSATTTAPVTTTPPPPTTPAAGAVDKTIPVRVLNNSMVSGLAAKTANDLAADGWNIAETGNYGTGVISKTTVYYGSSAGEKAAALAIANQLGITAEPRFAGIMDSPPGIIVIVTGN
ncbi:MAG: Non-specific serine/threonine protein kinase [Nocardia sp.]|uniref:LytR C-terminal domain-containing protein n=1 Tax=Nocardia sp. TaxID=1821 RepID=UPI00262E18F5|nr:LytR C-terminal domain-containing protein [Nocardia sp.]MCU1647510.1 Non-specific serine/threonine protein kinase [Nocardia sp.]